jgi:hypothetical protein
MKIRLIGFAAILLTGPAHAQGINGFQAASPDLRFGGDPFYSSATEPVSGAFIPTYRTLILPEGSTGTTFIGDGIGNRQYVSIDQFASVQQVNAMQSREQQFAFFMRRDFDRLAQGVALASALTVMPPNAGDRFALTVSGAGFDGRGAGAISGTYRVNEDVLVFGGYARSADQNLVKGGATFSFR